MEEEASRSDTKTVNPNQLEDPEKQSDNQDLTTKTIEEVSSVNTDIQKEVKNLIDSLKLLEEDIKGITVDTLL